MSKKWYKRANAWKKLYHRHYIYGLSLSMLRNYMSMDAAKFLWHIFKIIVWQFALCHKTFTDIFSFTVFAISSYGPVLNFKYESFNSSNCKVGKLLCKLSSEPTLFRTFMVKKCCAIETLYLLAGHINFRKLDATNFLQIHVDEVHKSLTCKKYSNT